MNKYALYLLALIDTAEDGLIKLSTRSIPIHPMIGSSSFYSALTRLEKKELISKKKVGRQNAYVLTSLGKKILQGPSQKKDRTDGLSTIVIFDIPEEKRKQRNTLRRYLKDNGYTILQKSVLIAPFEISIGLKDLIKELKVRQYVSIIDGRVNYNF
ncbi:MAG: CRISPR-associated endonuclease Cas2 [Candidatus Doudnabacteria bacterium]|nr:CRISPR-associated endonuclease Cas2 [Candidatus Doudnabacteria bacterium]